MTVFTNSIINSTTLLHCYESCNTQPNDISKEKGLRDLNEGTPIRFEIENKILLLMFCLKSPQSSRQSVGFLNIKPEFEPQARNQNKMQKVFLRRFSLSRFLATTLRANKIAMKSFSKNLSFEVDLKLQIPPLIYKINTHNISGVRNQVNNPD